MPRISPNHPATPANSLNFVAGENLDHLYRTSNEVDYTDGEGDEDEMFPYLANTNPTRTTANSLTRHGSTAGIGRQTPPKMPPIFVGTELLPHNDAENAGRTNTMLLVAILLGLKFNSNRFL